MTERKVYCDHCGKVLDAMSDYTDITIEASHKMVNADLCTDCFERLCEQIHNFCKREGGE
jgi:hypothetical protein